MKNLSLMFVLAGLMTCLASCSKTVSVLTENVDEVPTDAAIGCEHVGTNQTTSRTANRVHPQFEANLRNDKKLVRGQKIPNFKLSSLNGKKVNLSDVLSTKDFVLIDFWASWCKPCVAMFPELKNLRTDYAARGFEIVSVSLDHERSEWVAGAKQHEIPWINVVELESFQGDVATEFGVTAIPKNYLVDSDGCIIGKEIPPRFIKKILQARYGDTSSEQNPGTIKPW